MRLEKVEIVGFKSFCDRQELSFQAGVTGIVGPNGCGKSNISDAISWVLGEQSAKSLRGSSMEDVIFAGSQSRQPLGMAEVNLKVSGLNGTSPNGNQECVVTRRLYRSGESEYLMNGQVCRLRDIHELFMDTGLGSKAYSIIEQGKIGLILSSKPGDRRALIEEAAGITKYKARRRQTSLKLEAAQQNLLRVNDIVHEVEKQLESLKRQASKARRYRVLRDRMKEVERILFGRRFLDLQGQEHSLGLRLAEEWERERAAAVALETEEAQMEVRRNALYDQEASAEQARARVHELTLTVDRQQARSEYTRQQIQEAEDRAAQARTEAAELEERIGPLAATLQSRRSDEDRLRDELREAEQEASRAEAAVRDQAAREEATQAELDATRDAQVAIMARIAALQNARESASGSADRAAAELLKLAAEVQELKRERERVAELREEALARSRGVDELLAVLARDREEARERSRAARERSARLGEEVRQLQSEWDSLSGRLSSLRELVETHSAFDEGVRALLARPPGIQVEGVVADALDTDSASEKAVEAFLGDRLQAILTLDVGAALEGIRHLRESGAGRAAFLPLRALRENRESDRLRQIARGEARARGLLSDLYRVTGPHASAIRSWLPDALVVESLGEALEIAARRGPVNCATLAGETLRDGLLEGGRVVKGLLAPRREVREIAARQAEVDGLLGLAREREEAETARAEAGLAEVRSLEERVHDAEKEGVAIRHDLAVAEEELARLERKAVVLETEQGQAQEEQASAASRLVEIRQALEGAETERAEGSRRLTALTATLADDRAATEAAQERSAEVRSRLAALYERLAAVEAECLRLQRDDKELQDRIAAARRRGQEMEDRRQGLLAELRECERLLAEALAQRERLSGEAGRREDEVRDLRNELEAREQSLKERRRERETLRDALSELEVARARAGSDLDHLARECQQALGQTAAQAAALLTDDEKEAELSALEAKVQELRERLDRMGPVNVLAVEQAQELEERHRFLTAQRADLLASISELDQSIKKIDRTSRERFREAFQAINQHFGEVFRQLFGGGAAGLSLIDEEDILESGIDVMAQPPGKRLQNVMLLSGGEKALTAIALLFAIFQYKPSPFCILDEVDAPLDDANIGRFVRMLEGLKDQTQFVLITHSRKTMEIADQLYGVTMEEPGVSKLVSVKFG